MKNAILKVTNGQPNEALNALWRNLLQKKLVDALLIPLELPTGDNVVQTLLSDPEKLGQANVLAPVMPVNSARIVSQMTKVAPSRRKVGIVLRPCEMMALIELVKLKQASLENLVLIGIDCFGTYSVQDYAKLASEGSSPTEVFLKKVKERKDDPMLREACQVCECPFPQNVDLTVGLIGMDFESAILLQAGTQQGEKILKKLGLQASKDVDKREKAISQLVSGRKAKRSEFFSRAQKEIFGLEGFMSAFSTCIKCYNCVSACPICYCKECVFVSPPFELEAEKYLGWSDRKGTLRMPNDTLQFHLTRMTHMITSCVGCGACQEACPNDIPLFKIFGFVASKVQPTFDYIPGRSLEDELPLSTFKEEEFQDIGEK